jgi:hypothetical protein
VSDLPLAAEGAWVAPALKPPTRKTASLTPAMCGGPFDGEGQDMHHSIYSTVWFDPGLTTGWAVFGVYSEAMQDEEYKILENVAFWSAGQYGLHGAGGQREDEIADSMTALAEAWPDADVGCEDFILRQFRMDRTLLAPVRITARFEQQLRSTGSGAEHRGRGPGRVSLLQQPSMAMTTVTDERLKAWGYWNPLIAQPHARDAVRHAITWLRRRKAALVRAGRDSSPAAADSGVASTASA